ncbi:glutathione S-transferase family protein [Gammaproteobacteria bacterium AS21]
MGLLVEGKWSNAWYDTSASNGAFVRSQSQYRNWVSASGAAGPTGKGGFKAQAGRYHLYISLACPWAHRTMVFRALKGLQQMISVSIVNSYMGDDGWTFQSGPDVIEDSVNHVEFLHQLYTLAQPDYTGRVTVPLLWDKERQTIVSNESADIIRMFNSAFDEIGAKAGDYYPRHHRAEIDTLNKRIYSAINNGVYRAGFATTQQAYDEAVNTLFIALDELEQRLSEQRYLIANHLSEADWRLFTTLIRFDAVYVGHFKCDRNRIADYPALTHYLRELYQMPGIAQTVNIANIKAHYYQSHRTINPTAIVPTGSVSAFDQPHNRALLSV